jgi:hypothetical protein
VTRIALGLVIDEYEKKEQENEWTGKFFIFFLVIVA